MVTLPGCNNTGPESALQEQIAALNDMAGILDSIRDDASAEATLPRLEQAAQRTAHANQVAQSMDLEGDQKKEARIKYRKDLRMAEAKLRAANLRAQMAAPTKRREIQAALESMRIERQARQ
jgi:hypothetical protein